MFYQIQDCPLGHIDSTGLYWQTLLNNVPQTARGTSHKGKRYEILDGYERVTTVTSWVLTETQIDDRGDSGG